MIKKLWISINLWRFVCHWLLLCRNQLFRADLSRWTTILRPGHQANFLTFADLMLFFPEFRSLIAARLKCRHRYMAKLLEITAKPLPLLNIDAAHIAGGLYIQHGFATIIAPKEIGRNCWINQGVTIGYTNAEDCPIIGDEVTIGAGAKVLGKCHIGNKVKIGANCVVVKDVPDNCTVVGCPAYIVRRNGIKVREML